MKRYIAKGIVWGNCWGGGQCGYTSHILKASSMKKLNKQIEEGISNGSLDSGMGYEKVVGAVMSIEVREEIKVARGSSYKPFTHSDYNIKTYGDIPKGIIAQLVESVLCMQSTHNQSW